MVRCEHFSRSVSRPRIDCTAGSTTRPMGGIERHALSTAMENRVMATNFPIRPWLATGVAWLLLAASTAVPAQTCQESIPRVAPDSRYTVSEPGPAGEKVVIDHQTGLMWKQCHEGQAGEICLGTASEINWIDALTAANNSVHAGFNDWRLPNITELLSLVETGCLQPAINTTVFPNSFTDDYDSTVWSSTTNPITQSYAWGIDYLTDGSSRERLKTAHYPVRLVRGGQWFDTFSSKGDATPVAFELAAQTSVPVSSQRTSSPVTVAGLGEATVTGIRVSGAVGSSYSINSEDDADFTSAPGVVEDGDVVRVRHTSAATHATVTTTTLTIGSLSGNFVTTTIEFDQAITFGANPGPVTYGDSASVSASADSGLDVVYGVAAGSESVCSVNASTGAITTLAVGDCIITADQPGDADAGYKPAPQQTQTVQIVPLAITVTADARTKVYGADEPASLTYTVVPALVNGDSLPGALARAAGENVGTYAIGQGTLSATSNYTLSFVGADFTITPRVISVTAHVASKTYGESDPPMTYGFTPELLNGDTFSGNLMRAPGEDAGVYVIVQGGLTLGNNYAITFHSADFTIHKAVQAALVVNATPASILLGETSVLSTSGGSGTGAVSYEVTVGEALCNIDEDELTGMGQGTCTVTATKAADTNYLVETATATVEVTVTPKADLEIAKDASRATAMVGDDVVFSIVVSNIGPNDVTGASVIDIPPATLVDVEWACIPPPVSSVTCPDAPHDAGQGAMNVLVDLPADEYLRYDLSGTLQGVIGAQIQNTASVAVPDGVADPDGDNNSSTASVLIVPEGIFADGFEAEQGALAVPAAEKARVRK